MHNLIPFNFRGKDRFKCIYCELLFKSSREALASICCRNPHVVKETQKRLANAVLFDSQGNQIREY